LSLRILIDFAVAGPKDTEAGEVFRVTFSDYEKYLPYLYKEYQKNI